MTDYEILTDKEREDIMVKYIYIRHKEDIDFRRAIMRFLVYPKGYEFCKDMCMTSFNGKGLSGSWHNIRPHGNSKSGDQYMGKINPDAKARVFDLFDENVKISEVLKEMQSKEEPLRITRYHTIHYLYQKWCSKRDVYCTNNPAKKLAHLVEAMKNKDVKLIHSIHQSADGNPVITLCPDWVQTAMINACAIRARKLKKWEPSDLDVGK